MQVLGKKCFKHYENVHLDVYDMYISWYLHLYLSIKLFQSLKAPRWSICELVEKGIAK